MESSKSISYGAYALPVGAASGSAKRQYYWDLARALLLLGGIPYHTALIYYPGREWRISSPDKEPLGAALSDFLTSFRMPVFFVVAGYFSWMILKKKGARDWLAERFVRLGLPLLFGAFVINTMQMWIIAETHPNDPHLSFGSQFFSMGPQWVRHLWFLYTLIFYSIILAALARFSDRLASLASRVRVARLFDLSPTFQILTLACTCAVAKLLVAMVFSVAYKYNYEMPLSGAVDLQKMATYIPDFFFGVLIMAQPRLLQAVKTFTPVAAVAMILAMLNMFGVEVGNGFARVLPWLFSGIISVGMTNLIISAAYRWFDRPSTMLSSLVDASFTIYLVHQPIILALGWLFIGISLPPLMEEVTICFLCVSLSYAIHRMMRKNSTLLLLFNGMQRPSSLPKTLTQNV